jgi:hypothetical protein
VARRFRLLAEKDPSLFAGIPKLFYDFDSEREATNRSLGPNITGVWASLDRHRETLELALALSPEARKVVVVSGASPTNKVVVERIESEFRSYEGRAQFSYIIGEPVDEVQTPVSRTRYKLDRDFLRVHERQNGKRATPGPRPSR